MDPGYIQLGSVFSILTAGDSQQEQESINGECEGCHQWSQFVFIKQRSGSDSTHPCIHCNVFIMCNVTLFLLWQTINADGMFHCVN